MISQTSLFSSLSLTFPLLKTKNKKRYFVLSFSLSPSSPFPPFSPLSLSPLFFFLPVEDDDRARAVLGQVLRGRAQQELFDRALVVLCQDHGGRAQPLCAGGDDLPDRVRVGGEVYNLDLVRLLRFRQERDEARRDEVLGRLDVFAVDGRVGGLQHKVPRASDADAADDFGDRDGHDVNEVDVVAWARELLQSPLDGLGRALAVVHRHKKSPCDDHLCRERTRVGGPKTKQRGKRLDDESERALTMNPMNEDE